MDILTTEKKGNKALVSVRAYKGDAMTLLAMSIDESIRQNFTGLIVMHSSRFSQRSTSDNEYCLGCG